MNIALAESPLMTSAEVMSYLKTSRSTLYRLMEAGTLPGHKVGAHWRFYEQDVKACVQKACIQLVDVTKQGEVNG